MKYALLLLAAVCIAIVGCASVDRHRASDAATVAASGAHAPTHCPECGGGLVKVGTIYDDTEKPSKNIAVWNRSICANVFYGPDSMICTNCWLAYLVSLDCWERSSELPGSFRRPLSAAIRECPLPRPEDAKSRVVYSQQMGAAGVDESVAFWCTDSVEFVSRLNAFAREQNLSLRLEQRGRIANQVFVIVKTKLVLSPPLQRAEPASRHS